MLLKGWSPEIISGRLKKKKQFIVSHEAIYQWIYKEAPHLMGPWFVPVPPRSSVVSPSAAEGFISRDRVSIQERPAAANTRKEPGHWETDLVVGKDPPRLFRSRWKG